MGNRVSHKEGTPSKNETPSKAEEIKEIDAKDKENIFPTFPEDNQEDKTSIVNETFEEESAGNTTDVTTTDNSINKPDSSQNDKYSCIALLDDEQEDEKWEERTTVITRTDHENYITAAGSILQEVLSDVKTPVKGNKAETPTEDDATNISSQTGFASANTSLVSTYRTTGLDSGSETDYESATENEASFTEKSSIQLQDDSELDIGNKLLDFINIKDDSEDIETVLKNLKLQVTDRETTPRAAGENTTDTNENINSTPVQKEANLSAVQVLNSTVSVPAFENLCEVAQETSNLDITDPKCQAEKKIESEKIEKEGSDSFDQSDTNIENEAWQEADIASEVEVLEFVTPPEEINTVPQFEAAANCEILDGSSHKSTDKDYSPKKENNVYLETTPSNKIDNLGTESAQDCDNIIVPLFDNSENEYPAAKDQPIDGLTEESKNITDPISSSEKADVVEHLPKSEQHESVLQIFETPKRGEKDAPQPAVISTSNNETDPMDALLNGFEKIKIAETPKPAEATKLFDYNIRTGEIVEIEQKIELPVEQQLKINLITRLNEAPDIAIVTNADQTKEQHLEHTDNQETDSVTEKLHNVIENETSEETGERSECSPTTSADPSEDNQNAINTDDTTSTEVTICNKHEEIIEVVETPCEDIATNNSDATESILDIVKEIEQKNELLTECSPTTSADPSEENQNAINTDEATNTEVTICKKHEDIIEVAETPCEDTATNDSDATESILDIVKENSSADQSEVNGDIFVEPQVNELEKAKRLQSEEAQFDSLPDLEHVDSSLIENTVLEDFHEDLMRESVEIDIPNCENDIQSGNEQEEDLQFLPPPPPSLLSIPSSDTPDLPDPPSDSEFVSHKIETGTEFPEPPKEEELKLLEQNFNEKNNSLPEKPSNTSEKDQGKESEDISSYTDSSHTIPSLAVPHFEPSDGENSSTASESKIQLVSPSVPVQLSRSSPCMSKPTAIVKPCNTSDLNTTKPAVLEEAVKPYQACETEASGKSADVSSAGIACTVVQSQVNSETAVKDTNMDSEEDLPIPPAKGYNLDFLDQLDDPNFNPFETKTAVKNQFEASEIVQESTESNVINGVPESNSLESSDCMEKTPKELAPSESDTKNTSSSADVKLAKKPKKALIKRNIKTKKSLSPKKPIEPVKDVEAEDNSPLPPPKSYNMDFLDKLEDANFNPFETKTAVKDQFDVSEAVPHKEQVNGTDETVTVNIEEQQDITAIKAELIEQQKVEKVKKPVPKKPLLKKRNKKTPPPAETETSMDSEEVIPVPSKGYNMDFLDQLDDPNFNPFETKTAVVDKFDDSEPVPETITEGSIPENENKVKNLKQNVTVKNEEQQEIPSTKAEAVEEQKVEKVKKPQPKKPWLNKMKKKTAPPAVTETSMENEEAIPVPSKGYNMDFLDQLDDPNFNPFETKTAVVDKFDDSKPVSETITEEPIPENENKVKNIKENMSVNKEEQQDIPATKTEVVEEQKVEKVKKPQPKKPWLNKMKKKAAPPAETETSIDNEEVIPVPSKGYNMDFLDQLEDPNFNPFETKTAVVDKFDDSKPVSETIMGASTPENENEDNGTTEVSKPEEKKEKSKEEKKPKKQLPPKPWLKKGLKNKVQEDTNEDEKQGEISVPGKGYDLDILDKLDDPNFNPFETKASVSNNCEAIDQQTVEHATTKAEGMETIKDDSRLNAGIKQSNTIENMQEAGEEQISQTVEDAIPSPKKYNLDFLDKLDDPNFDPFSTKTKVVDDVSVGQGNELIKAPIDLSEELPVVKDSTPEFEQHEAQIVSTDEESTETFVAKEPTAFSIASPPTSPTSFSSGYSTLPKSTQEKLSQAMTDSDFSFCVPEPVNLEKWMSESKENIDEIEQMSLSTSSDFSLSAKDTNVPHTNRHNLNFSLDHSVLVTQAANLPLNKQSVPDNLNCNDLTSMVNGDVGNLTKLGLLHEARLLDKDKELSRVTDTVREKQKEIEFLKHDLQQNTESNRQMMIIVEEFEKTIGQLIAEKEREQVCNEISRDRIQNERNQILEDLQAVERAFNDLHRKYERTKEVVAGFKTNEDVLKATVEDLSRRYKKGEDRYELLKSHAETKLNEANSRIAEIQKSKSSEIAKLTALLRKAEMRVASLERSVEQKSRENQELTTICDELISKVGS
eukprot:GFUD01039007.1.p1 GENE.GFUD01039007.1~~GFUD01039007.1.p1  ORF type:complete len:2150 (+),score=757.42 GFUD01039007.1:317-6766(+)